MQGEDIDEPAHRGGATSPQAVCLLNRGKTSGPRVFALAYFPNTKILM